MKAERILAVCQILEEVEDLAIANNTTVSTCGYITCAMVQFLAEQQSLTPQFLRSVNFGMLKPYIEKVMQSIASNRRIEIKKFMKLMNQSQKKNYLRDWVANYEIGDYLESIQDKCLNPNIYFFRQVSYDHPEAMENLKFEESQRVKEQMQFKGTKHFYSSFNPYMNHYKQQFEKEVKKNHEYNLPIIIATDVLGHFNTTVILNGQIFVLDSLPYVQSQYDDEILEAISYYHKISYLKGNQQQMIEQKY